MKFIIDRFEGDFAVVEIDNKVINLPLEIIPQNAKEGDVISIEIDFDETNKRKENIRKLMDNLWEN